MRNDEKPEYAAHFILKLFFLPSTYSGSSRVVHCSQQQRLSGRQNTASSWLNVQFIHSTIYFLLLFSPQLYNSEGGRETCRALNKK